MTNDSAEPRGARRYLLLAVKLAVSVILLSILFSRIDASRLWSSARQASLRWLVVALGVYLVSVLGGVWRWHLLLRAQQIEMRDRTLLGSMLVALFFNNFLPSNIGGDVIRIRDSAKPARSKTIATTVVLADRVIGLIGLVFVAALGATIGAGIAGRVQSPIWPSWLWAGFLVMTIASAPVVLIPAGVGRLLQPLTVFHPEWVGDRIESITAALARFRDRPDALAACFAGAVFVQASIVLFYISVARSLQIPIAGWDLAVIVPLSFVVQILPVSLNGFGVREATFSLYFTRIGLPLEAGLLVSLVGAAVTMAFSLSGAAVWFARGHH
jgi:uncharacterized membrane protein YbhN (UPF0104 family)